jgi:hypothetical protein
MRCLLPVEADARRAPAEFRRSRQCRQSKRDIGKRARLLGAFFGISALASFLFFPQRLECRPVERLRLCAKDVWMTAHEFVVDGCRNFREIEPSAFLRHAGVKHHLKQQITQLVAQARRIVALDGVGDLVGLLDGVRRNAAKVLRKIPTAALLRIPQPRHHLKERGERRFGGAHRAVSLVHSR